MLHIKKKKQKNKMACADEDCVVRLKLQNKRVSGPWAEIVLLMFGCDIYVWKHVNKKDQKPANNQDTSLQVNILDDYT